MSGDISHLKLKSCQKYKHLCTVFYYKYSYYTVLAACWWLQWLLYQRNVTAPFQLFPPVLHDGEGAQHQERTFPPRSSGHEHQQRDRLKRHNIITLCYNNRGLMHTTDKGGAWVNIIEYLHHNYYNFVRSKVILLVMFHLKDILVI